MHVGLGLSIRRGTNDTRPLGEIYNVGGYAASASLVGAVAVMLSLVGMARSEAYALCAMLGFFVYLALALWAAAERRLFLVIAVLAGLTAGSVAVAMHAAALVGEA